MMSRVRKFNNNDFYIYTNKIKLHKNSKSWNIQDLQQKSIYNDDTILKNEYVFNKEENTYYIERKNYLYRTIWQYNKVEELNKNSKIFLARFIEIANIKGYKYEFMNDERNEQDEVEEVKTKTFNDMVSEAENIDEETYKLLIEKQKQGTALETEKLQIKKYLLKQQLGIDIITSKHVKTYYNKDYELKNLMGLIDNDNIRHKDELIVKEQQERLKFVKEIINKLGFDSHNIFNNTDTIYNSETFTHNINSTLELIRKYSNSDPLYNQLLNKSKQDIKLLLDNKLTYKIRYINTILHTYGLTLYTIQSRKNLSNDSNIDTDDDKNKMNFYSLKINNNLHEVISNRIKYKGLKIHDSNKIFSPIEPDVFKSYITSKPYKPKKNQQDYFIDEII